jgi:hypothetical protein
LVGCAFGVWAGCWAVVAVAVNKVAARMSASFMGASGTVRVVNVLTHRFSPDWRENAVVRKPSKVSVAKIEDRTLSDSARPDAIPEPAFAREVRRAVIQMKQNYADSVWSNKHGEMFRARECVEARPCHTRHGAQIQLALPGAWICPANSAIR